MINEDRIGFVSAFTEAVRPDDPRGRSGKRMLVVALSVVLSVILSCVVYGWLGKKHSPAPGTGQAAALASPAAHILPSFGAAGGSGTSARPAWTAVAGPTCRAAGASFSVSGYVAATGSQQTGWFTSSSGGYRGGGCAGGFVSVPMSGHAQEYNPNRFALWKFDFTARFTTGLCRLYTYIPDSPALRYVGGNPTYYRYYGAGYPGGKKPGGKKPGGKTPAPLGTYQVNQVRHRGTWVANSTFEVRTGKVTVELLDAGKVSKNAHHAAAQMRLACWPP
jgi:hypothetical protein